jgi:uncharacterized protein (TIGR02118 family)
MSFKVIALLKGRADLDRAAFVDYYETRHVPLILEVTPGVTGYRRNFADFEGAFVYPGAAPFDFDVVTELWFADRAAYDRAMVVSTTPEIAARIAADEENFLDRSKTRLFVVEEKVTDIAALSRSG